MIKGNFGFEPEDDMGFMLESAGSVSAVIPGSEDLEQVLKDEKTAKEQETQLFKLRQVIAQAAKEDPNRWTYAQTREYFKNNPAKDIFEEATQQAFLERKKQELKEAKDGLFFEVDRGQGREPTPKEAAGMQKSWEKRKGITRDVLGDFITEHPLFPVFAITMPAFEASYLALRQLPRFSKSKAGQKLLSMVPDENVKPLESMGLIGKASLNLGFGPGEPVIPAKGSPRERAAEVLDAVQNLSEMLVSGKIEEKAAKVLVEDSLRLLGGKLYQSGYGVGRVTIPQEAVERVGKVTPSGEALLNNLRLREWKIPENLWERPFVNLGKGGKALVPEFKPGDFVMLGKEAAKILKVEGQSAQVAVGGKILELALKDLVKSDLLPQEIPEKHLKYVPENKKQYVKDVFLKTSGDEVVKAIEEDPDYAAAMDRNEKLGQKAFVSSFEPEDWPEYYQSYLDKYNPKEILPAQGQPEAVVMIGLPGAQKSQIIKKMGVEKTHVQIDPDDPKKYFIPESVADGALAGYVKDESGFMAETLLASEAMAQGKNIVWPKIGKNPETLIKLFNSLREAGYKIRLVYNKLSTIESVKRAYKRFLEEKRLVDHKYIQGVGDLTIQQVYDIVKSRADEYSTNDVNVPFDQSIEEIEKGVGDEKLIRPKAAEAAGPAGPGREERPLYGPGVPEVEAAKAKEAASPEVIPPEVPPEETVDPFLKEYDSMPPEEQAKFDLEMDDLRKTPEGNLLLAIHRAGGLKAYEKEEYSQYPLWIKNKKGLPLDEMLDAVKSYGWQFEDTSELHEAIMNAVRNPSPKVDRAALQQIIKEAEKNKALQAEIEARMGKRRKFITTVKKAEKTAPEVKAKVESRYEPITNKETLEQAQEFVKASYNEAVEMVEGPGRPTAFSNAVAIVLIDKAQAEGRFADAIRLVEKTAEKQTALGQAIQALSMYARLTPEGILQFAVRQIKKAREGISQKERISNFEKEARGKTPAEIDELAKKYKVPHISEAVAGALRQMAQNIQKMPSIEDWPDFKDVPPRWAYQYTLDMFKQMEDSGGMTPDVRRAFQFMFDAFQKGGVTGENVPWSREEQAAFEEWKKTGNPPDTSLNVPWSKETQKAWYRGASAMARARKVEIALMLKKISDQVPVGFGKKISMIQTMDQLLNFKTFLRNILGNVGFMGMENIAETFATALDVAMSLITGKRTVTLPRPGIQAKGLVQGLAEGTQEALLGINLRSMGQKFDLPRNGVFNSGVLGALERTMGVALKATDQAFYQAAYNQSLRQQMALAGEEEPTPEMIEKAHLEGLYRTFQDDNVISQLFVNIKKALNFQKDFGVGDIVLKYPKTPGNLLARGIEYSPFGFAKVCVQLTRDLLKKEFDQEDFVRSTARTLAGSALLVGAGAILAGLGIISGKKGKDKDVVATQKEAGIGEYQINVDALKRFTMSGLDPEQAALKEDDTFVTYDWFLPSSIGLAIGANMVLSPDRNITDRVLNVPERLIEAFETLEGQPLVRGLKVLTGKSTLMEGIAETLQDIPASFVPTLLNQIRQLTDNTARNQKDPNFFTEVANKVKYRIPGLSGMLPPQVTPLGEDRQMYQDGSNNPFNVFVNPAFVSKYKPDPVSKMVLDIYQTTGETVHFPRVAQAKIKLGNDTPEPMELTPEQYTEYQRYIGTKTRVLYGILAENQGFMNLSDDEKARKLQGYLTDINTAAKIEVLGYRPKHVSQDVITIIKSIADNKRKIDAVPVQKEDFGFIPE